MKNATTKPKRPRNRLGSRELVRVLKLCDQKRDVDDRLGQVSDHEGGKDGPTWSVWSNTDAKGYRMRVEYWIGEHKRGIKILRELLRIKESNHPNS